MVSASDIELVGSVLHTMLYQTHTWNDWDSARTGNAHIQCPGLPFLYENEWRKERRRKGETLNIEQKLHIT